MIPDYALLDKRPALKQVLLFLGMSKSSFYRHYRPVDATEHEKYTRQLDIREVEIAGRPTLTFCRDAIIALYETRREKSDGTLATEPSTRAERLGWCSRRGFGSKVYKDGQPRVPSGDRRKTRQLSIATPHDGSLLHPAASNRGQTMG